MGSGVMSGTKILRFKTIKNPSGNMSVWFSGLYDTFWIFNCKSLRVQVPGMWNIFYMYRYVIQFTGKQIKYKKREWLLAWLEQVLKNLYSVFDIIIYNRMWNLHLYLHNVWLLLPGVLGQSKPSLPASLHKAHLLFCGPKFELYVDHTCCWLTV